MLISQSHRAFLSFILTVTWTSHEVTSHPGQRLPGLWETTWRDLLDRCFVSIFCNVRSLWSTKVSKILDFTFQKILRTTPPWRLLATLRAKRLTQPRIPGSKIGRRGWGASTKSNSCKKEEESCLFFLKLRHLPHLPIPTKRGNSGQEAKEREDCGDKGADKPRQGWTNSVVTSFDFGARSGDN